MKIFLPLFVFWSLGVASANEVLEIGAAAPPIVVDRWFQGGPIGRFEPGKIYVVEFWATWCAPCVESIPHLNELQKRYEGKVQFIGIDASERAQSAADKLRTLEEFLASGRVTFEYPHAFDPTGRMVDLWGNAARQVGIPHAFIIDQQGRVAAITHPMIIDNILEAVVSGTWESSGAMAQHRQKRIDARERAERLDSLDARLDAAASAGDWSAALAIADEGIALTGKGSRYRLTHAGLLISHMGRIEEGYPLVEQLVQQSLDSPQALGSLLLLLVDPNVPVQRRNLELAAEIADRIEHHFESEKPDYVQYRFAFYPPVAEYYFRMGATLSAARLQRLAIEALPDRYRAQMEAGMLESLRKYAEPECKDGVCVIPPCESLLK
mgnify:CR=1 FL=1